MFAVRDHIRQNPDQKVAKRAGRRAAVLVPLCLKGGDPSVLFTVRSRHVSTHKGQVSFPGGHLSPGETATEAAIREASEELGESSISGLQLIARCTAVPAITGTAVQPIIGLLPHDIGTSAPHSCFDPCSQEVERVFALTLRELHDPELVSEGGVKDGDAVRPRWPIYRGDPLGAEVWGLTAYILQGVLRELLTPLYQKHTLDCTNKQSPIKVPVGGTIAKVIKNEEEY